MISKRLEGVVESVTLKLNALVNQLKAGGADIINLTAGEPDWNVEDSVKEAVIGAVRENRSRYTPVAGIPALREAVVAKTLAQQPSIAKSQPWTAKNVVVSNGGKQAIFNTLLATLNPGDEVLIPAPFWLSYPEMVMLAGGTPKIVRTSEASGYKVTVADLQAAATARTKMLILNSPSNPTGVAYSRSEFKAIGEWVMQRNQAASMSPPVGHPMIVISDEIYDVITYDDFKFTSFLEATPALRESVVTINGLSKSGAMTGWRVGWTVASAEITDAIQILQGQSTSGINAPAQYGALAALKLTPETFEPHRVSLQNRRDICREYLSREPGLKFVVPNGAFYIFVNFGKFFKPGENSVSFAERLIKEAGVALVPGGPFGEDQCLRLSFSCDEASLRQGLERILKALA